MDRGLTHIALQVSDLDASLAFYERYAGLRVVHERTDRDSGGRVAWITDGTRPFVVVLIESAHVGHPLGGFGHLGVGCPARDDVDRLLDAAAAEGRSTIGPFDEGYPVGYYGFVVDPDGHNLEVSFGQEVALTVAAAKGTAE
jgi:catechol 2,3-dioxygenase-like lactoylglutathione lyase family enzyme